MPDTPKDLLQQGLGSTRYEGQFEDGPPRMLIVRLPTSCVEHERRAVAVSKVIRAASGALIDVENMSKADIDAAFSELMRMSVQWFDGRESPKINP